MSAWGRVSYFCSTAPPAGYHAQALGFRQDLEATTTPAAEQLVFLRRREEDHWLVLADWVEEHDDPRRAELLRLHRRLVSTCCQPDEHPERAGWQGRVVEL